MTRKVLRIRVSSDGALEVVDPGFDALPLLREVDQRFAVRSAPLPCFASPRFMRSPIPRSSGSTCSAVSLSVNGGSGFASLAGSIGCSICGSVFVSVGGAGACRPLV